MWRTVVRGLRALVRRRSAEQELDDEVRHFMEEAEADLLSGGATPQEARRTVRLQYGDPLTAREDVRASGWESWVDTLGADLRLSARSLRKSPGFTTVVVLTLGLGVGAATAIFSVVRPVLFEPLSYVHPERILSIEPRAEDGTRVKTAYGTFLELAQRTRVFESLAVSKPWQPTLTGGEEPQRLEGQSVSAAYFDVLGVRPALGQGFDPAQDRPGAPRSVLLSDALWRARFGGDPSAVGRTVRLDGDAYLVAGVLPPSFQNVTAPQARLWTLLQYDAAPASFDSREWGHHLDMVGRVREGTDLQDAARELEGMAANPLPNLLRPTWAGLEQGFSTQRLRDAVTADARPTMVVVLGAVGLLVLVTCVNVILLLLARGARRRGEFALRVALGAGRARLARYLVTESLVLSALGGMVGLLVADAGLAALVALSPPSLPHLESVAVDGTALVFALALTTAVGIVFGLAPGLHRSKGGPLTARASGRGVARRSRSTRRALVVAEVALAMVLLVGAGLVLRSTARLFSQPLGFEAPGRVVVQIYGTGLEGGDAVTHRFFDEALDVVRALPGVVAAGETTQLPLSGDMDLYGVSIPDGTGTMQVDGPAYRYAVTPGYLEAMGIQVRRGRGLRLDDESGAPPAVVVSQRLASRLFQNADPIGRTLQFGPPRDEPYTIVGVADDVKQASLGTNDTEAVYVTSHQWPWADRVRWMVVRTEGDPLSMVASIRQAIWSVNPDQPLVRAQAMETVVTRSEARRSFVLMIMVAFAAAATILAVVGIYGVVAGMVSERLPEMGIRAALGAPRERIVALVVRQGLTLAGAGLLAGMAVSLLANRAVTSFLFGVSTLDPATYLGVAALLGAGAAAACVVPAVRAARVDPVRTLNAE